MSIQSNLNQALSVFGVMAQMSPDLKKKKELQKLGQYEKSLTKIAATPGSYDVKRRNKLEEKFAEIAEKRADIDPTPENYRELTKADPQPISTSAPITDYDEYLKYQYEEDPEYRAQVDAMRAQEQERKAAADLQRAQEEKRKSREISDMMKTRISWGGTLGDLDEKLRARILDQIKKGDLDE